MPNRARLWTAALWCADLSFVALLLAWPFSWALAPGAIPWWAPGLPLGALIALRRRRAAAAVPAARGPLDRPGAQRLCLVAATLCVGLGGIEKLLDKLCFSAELAPVVFELANEAGVTERRKGFDDPDLIWSFRKGEKYHGRMINALGYREREIETVKAPGVRRVICMGDSVTAQGEPGYSQYLHDALNRQAATGELWEAFNMAVYGYSAAQGHRAFQLHAAGLAPDVVTLFFGWNDHWIEMRTDRLRMARRLGPVRGWLHERLKNRRLYQVGVLAFGGRAGAARTEPGFRVPPDEYVQVLTEFIADIRAAGAQPLLITAPRRHVTPGKRKFPEYEAKIDFNATHDHYAELTRRVAREQDVALLDLHATFADPAYDRAFMADGIHFKQQGLKQIGEALAERILTLD